MRLGGTHAGWLGKTRQKEERKQRKCFPGRHPHCLFPVRVSPESSGLVNLISCQNSHDNESWPAGWHSSFGTAAVEIAQLIYEQEIVLRWHQQAAQLGRGRSPPARGGVAVPGLAQLPALLPPWFPAAGLNGRVYCFFLEEWGKCPVGKSNSKMISLPPVVTPGHPYFNPRGSVEGWTQKFQSLEREGEMDEEKGRAG